MGAAPATFGLVVLAFEIVSCRLPPDLYKPIVAYVVLLPGLLLLGNLRIRVTIETEVGG